MEILKRTNPKSRERTFDWICARVAICISQMSIRKKKIYICMYISEFLIRIKLMWSMLIWQGHFHPFIGLSQISNVYKILLFLLFKFYIYFMHQTINYFAGMWIFFFHAKIKCKKNRYKRSKLENVKTRIYCKIFINTRFIWKTKY